MKKLIVTMLIFIFTISINVQTVIAIDNTSYKLFVEGQQIEIESRIIDNCIYYPAKQIAIALGVVDTETPTAKARWVLNYSNFLYRPKSIYTNLFH